ncbi:MAG: helix-turn-helix domain-containing protein [Bdellovibrionales bacterium]|nr:helix-turn-helix domain-containing protein [Bdellovibrionales bacterium]
MAAMNKDHLVLTVREVAKLLRIHRPKVYELIKEGAIEGFKLGADWRIKRESVEKLIGPIPADFWNQDNEIKISSNGSTSNTVSV